MTTRNELLLRSMAELSSIIDPLIAACQPKSICEIGVEWGTFSRQLLEYARQHGIRYTGVDPVADSAIADQIREAGGTLLTQPSLEVLPDLDLHDLYLIDSDHNYYTVSGELECILSRTAPEHSPLILLHDIGWPAGRRDLYYDPDRIPADSRHACSWESGAIPGQQELSPNGYYFAESRYRLATATHEGGPRNGVLTAVEDILAKPFAKGFALLEIPSVFGLGILARPDHLNPESRQWWNEMETSLKYLSPLLQKLEANRIELNLAYRNAVHTSEELSQTYENLSTHASGLESKFENLHLDYKTLIEKYQALHDHSESLLQEYQNLERHAQSQEAEIERLKQKVTED